MACQFTGQGNETSLGICLYGHWYDPTSERFIRTDSVVPNPGNPQSMNRYSYGLNNPLPIRIRAGIYKVMKGHKGYQLRSVDSGENTPGIIE
ncbi:MAG: hypothetical protein ACYC6L_17820 [Anaerolineae bacterium]